MKSEPINKVNETEHYQKIIIFGENGVRVEFNDTFYKVTRSGWHRVALCNYDSIVLTSYAERGAEYHEAFHRVVELFLTKK